MVRSPASVLHATATRVYARRLYAPISRYESTKATTEANEASDLLPPPTPQQGWLYIDSVFPIRLGRWDPRHYIGVIREDTLITRLERILSSVHTHGFTVLDIEPHTKDGGVFVHFQFTAPGDDVEGARMAALKRIESDLSRESHKQGGVPNWTGLGQGKIWVVKGKPWREDLNRYSSPVLKVAFEGPDVNEEALYSLFRPFGRIQDITNPTPPPAGALRAATISFHRLSSATIARNVLHGLELQPAGTTSRTRLRTAYQPPVQAHVVRDWLQSHPKIAGPLLLFLVGTLTYTVFDPIRTLMVEGKILDWFDYKQYRVYQWIHSAAEPLFGPAPTTSTEHGKTKGSTSSPNNSGWLWSGDDSEVWKERRDAQDALERYLVDLPSTVAFIHGPQGSGKTRMLTAVIEGNGRKTLVIDCSELLKSSTDSAVINALARQTGYWPVFSFLNSLNTWIDLASVGLIGQKAGISTSLPTQVHDMLEVVKTSLARVSASYRADTVRVAQAEKIKQQRAEEEARRLERLLRGEWHDGRLDCVAGNGIMSELGIGDERLEGWVGTAVADDDREGSLDKSKTPMEASAAKNDIEGEKEISTNTPEVEKTAEERSWRSSLPSLPSVNLSSLTSSFTSLPGKLLTTAGVQDSASHATEQDSAKDAKDGGVGRSWVRVETEAVKALPIVVLRNYGSRGVTNKDSDEVLAEIARWAASLTEHQIAHVIVVSDNRENAKRLAKALPSKPLHSIALSDADPTSALSFVRQKLRDADGPDVLTQPEEHAYVSRLGGRASDLESLIHKVRGGLTVQEAVEDIIQRDAAELRKNAFGDDLEDAKGLPWTREQAWQLMKQLVKKDEIGYYDILVNMFKNDESALRSMEHAELISIGTDNGRPSTIRPGKPVYKYVFERLVSDPVFRSTQDIAVNEKAIASAEVIIRACEDELLKLREIGSSRTARKREDHLLDKMHDAQKKVVALEAQNADLKKLLAKAGSS